MAYIYSVFFCYWKTPSGLSGHQLGLLTCLQEKNFMSLEGLQEFLYINLLLDFPPGISKGCRAFVYVCEELCQYHAYSDIRERNSQTIADALKLSKSHIPSLTTTCTQLMDFYDLMQVDMRLPINTRASTSNKQITGTHR